MLISTKLAYIPTFKVVDVSEFVFRVFFKKQLLHFKRIDKIIKSRILYYYLPILYETLVIRRDCN